MSYKIVQATLECYERRSKTWCMLYFHVFWWLS